MEAGPMGAKPKPTEVQPTGAGLAEVEPAKSQPVEVEPQRPG